MYSSCLTSFTQHECLEICPCCPGVKGPFPSVAGWYSTGWMYQHSPLTCSGLLCSFQYLAIAKLL